MAQYNTLSNIINTKLPTNGSNLITATDVRSVFDSVIGSMPQVENIKNYGAIGDGSSHPLSERYSNLSAAQVDYSFATSLSNEIDRCALEKAIRTGKTAYIPDGTFIIDGITLSSMNVYIDSAYEATVKCLTTNIPMFSLSNCNLKIKHLILDGNSQAYAGFVCNNGGTIDINEIQLKNFGSSTVIAPTWVTGIYAFGVTSTYIKKMVCTNFNAIGNGTGADVVGAARGIIFLNAGIYHIGHFEMSGGNAEELDYFQVNTGCIGGVVDTYIARYNGNTRRCIKIQSGKNIFNYLNITKGSDFVAVSESTEAGQRNWNCVDLTTPDTAPYNTTLDIMGGYIDASGFFGSITASDGAGRLKVHRGTVVNGPVLNVIRTHDLAGAQNSPVAGFYTQFNAVGSGCDGVTFINFAVGAELSSHDSYCTNCIFIDPRDVAATIGLYNNTETKNIIYSNNKIITQTSGNLNTGYLDCLHVYNATNSTINNNNFIEDGNTTHHNTFIRYGTSTASGVAIGNTGPTNMLIVDKGSTTNVKVALSNGTETSAFVAAISDETTALTTGTNQLVFRFPFNAILTGIRANVTTAPVGSTIIVDIKKNGTSIFSTPLIIDDGEKTTLTSSSAAVLSTTSLAIDDEISVDLTQVGSTTPGAGLKVTFLYTN